MANSDILLLEAIKGLGSEGDTVSVRAGYARNFLFPRKLAIPVNQGNRKQIESLKVAKEKRVAEELEASKSLAEKIEQTNISIAVKTGDNGKMFGSVTSADILTRLEEENVLLEKKQLNVAQPIKDLGSHKIQVKLNSEIEATFNLEIVSENPIIPESEVEEANEEDSQDDS
ncbi:MAG: 50S ribosomal protein L9 [Puniceicoccaceae bacterium MED-G32]|jgi:large subunit ribosomal protein L9|nr:50S ribosomal protein L9 [Puniceicoccaceae bacterium]MAS98553.1 50S ribosomal protein L9 [Kiritimatiellaceae bacterium]PDH26516.1 MAG: 50S ribosomal protein L9 [Puniceicoccaceae bacterium MED-G32]CAI8283411.1 MAG: 50S ribosomal protein L9 [Puniceicoccaceae bacterium MED-G32]|tara:strand:+ start:1546 stop:2061 length:516 start_codon:yes stop_codon:yes gene_type:complete